MICRWVIIPSVGGRSEKAFLQPERNGELTAGGGGFLLCSF